MKKLLGIVVLGLLFFNINSKAEMIRLECKSSDKTMTFPVSISTNKNKLSFVRSNPVKAEIRPESFLINYSFNV